MARKWINIAVAHSPNGLFVYHVVVTRLEPKKTPDLWLEEHRQYFEYNDNDNSNDIEINENNKSW